MDNQKYTYNYSYTKPSNVYVITAEKIDNEENFRFVEDKNYKPSLLLLESIVKAQQDRIAGKASPIFSSVEEMKKWHEEQSE